MNVLLGYVVGILGLALITWVLFVSRFGDDQRGKRK